MKLTKIAAPALLLLVAAACGQSGSQLTKSGLDPKNFETTVDGKQTALYTLTNANGMEVCITNYGGRVVSIMVPDRDGEMKDVVLGFDSIASYLPENNQTDFGAAIGRYANRINKGQIVVDGDTIQLPTNNFGHTLHGGPDGWQYKVYDVKESNDSTLVLEIQSPDGDNGFPGNVTAEVTYRLTSDNALDISYKATSDKKTVINMTNHSYFNLNGDPSKPITDNELFVNAACYTPVDSTFMTTGEVLDVKGTPMDFNTPKLIGAEIENFDFEQLKNGNGYDHNWVLTTRGATDEVAVRLYSPSTGIQLEVMTDEPGVQVYTGNFLDGTVHGKHGMVYQQRAAVCLETQHYPDSPNKEHWPNVWLEPGQTYTSHCIYRFTTR